MIHLPAYLIDDIIIKSLMSKQMPNKPGQPTKYEGKMLKAVAVLCRLGAIDKEIAEALDVTETTINNWKLAHPEFFETIKTNKDVIDDRVEASLLERACGYEHPETKFFCDKGEIITAETTKHYPPDTAAAFIWLKNRRPNKWRDKLEIVGNMDISIIDPDDEPPEDND